ncbi:MAG: hypothetical protein WC677_03710 [Clostridia bacterium]|jgi:hypothetical protein
MLIEINELNKLGDNQHLLRYIDFTEFVSLLDRSSLYFSPLIDLSRYDIFEGELNNSEEALSKLCGSYEGKSNKIEIYKRNVAVCCWNINEEESYLMWKTYSDFNRGIVIKTTFKKLQESLKNNKKDVYIGMVNYQEDICSSNTELNPIFLASRKLPFFKEEKELRLIIVKSNFQKDFAKMNNDEEPKWFDYEKNIEIDIRKLIEEVIVSPGAEKWFSDLVKNILKKYDLCNIKVKESNIRKRVPKNISSSK